MAPMMHAAMTDALKNIGMMAGRKNLPRRFSMPMNTLATETAATAFQDAEHEIALRRALDAADLMLALDPELAAAADNPVGESVLLYAMSFGPLWAQLAEAPSQLPS